MNYRIIWVVLAFTALLHSSCKKQEMPIYSGGHYVQFLKSYQDTTLLSFFFHPGKLEVTVAYPVKLIGRMSEEDLTYEIGVDTDNTSAPQANYSIPSSFTFRKGKQIDTAYITVKNTPELKTREFKLAIYLKNTTRTSAGQHEYAYQTLKISDQVSKPSWWNADMDRYYLGPYSETKFRAFMLVTGVGDITPYDQNEQRVMMLQFKYYLIEKKEQGSPLLLDDGSDMLASVPLIG